jgi:hypothetical protein
MRSSWRSNDGHTAAWRIAPRHDEVDGLSAQDKPRFPPQLYAKSRSAYPPTQLLVRSLSGGQFGFDAPVRCPVCKSTNVKEGDLIGATR